MKTMTEREILEMVLVGFTAKRDQIENEIRNLQGRLNGLGLISVRIPKRPKAKRSAQSRISDAGKRAIARAARARWASYRRNKRKARATK